MKLLRASRWFGRSTFRFISRRVPTSDRRQGNGVLGYWGIGVLRKRLPVQIIIVCRPEPAR